MYTYTCKKYLHLHTHYYIYLSWFGHKERKKHVIIKNKDMPLLNEIGDEIHVLRDCIKYQSFRDEIYQVICDDVAFKRKTNTENFKYIMISRENHILKAV